MEQVQRIGQPAEGDDEPGRERQPAGQQGEADEGNGADADRHHDCIRNVDGEVGAHPLGAQHPLEGTDRGGESEDAEGAQKLLATEQVRNGPWYTRLSMGFYADYLRTQERITRATNSAALQLMSGVQRSQASADAYRLHNRTAMRFWMAVSLAPHSYLFAIFGMLPSSPVAMMAFKCAGPQASRNAFTSS